MNSVENDPFRWMMSQQVYEPAPIKRRSWRPHVMLILAALAIISGALIAVGEWL